LGEQLAEEDRKRARYVDVRWACFGSLHYRSVIGRSGWPVPDYVEKDDAPLSWKVRGGFVPYHDGLSMCLVAGWAGFQSPLLSIDPPFASFVATSEEAAAEASVACELDGVPRVHFGDRDRAIVWARSLAEASKLARVVLARHPKWNPVGEAPEAPDADKQPDPEERLSWAERKRKEEEREALAARYRWYSNGRSWQSILDAIEDFERQRDTFTFDPRPFVLDGGRRDRDVVHVFKPYQTWDHRPARRMDGFALWTRWRQRRSRELITAPSVRVRERIRELEENDRPCEL